MQLLNLTILTVLAFFAISIQASSGNHLLKPTNITTTYLIRKAGYPVEEHQVTTNDGYILTVHRIPYSSKTNNSLARQPIFLQHGILATSSDWVLIGPPNALAYILSDNGFDVWMGNSRGNRCSMKHLTIDPKSPVYWDFSWHEMGVYDLPAVFDYIKNKTGIEKFHYIGHSQGTTEFVVFCSTDPSCKKIIKAAHLLAPVIFAKNFATPWAKLLAPFFGNPDINSKVIGSFNIGPNTELVKMFSQIFCNDYSSLQFLCAEALYTLEGPSNYINKSMIPMIGAVLPAGASFKQLQHYLQEYNSGKFRQFDYGALFNKRIYGSAQPPEYSLDKISAPLYLYHSDNDFLATSKDVSQLVKVLPKGVVRGDYKVSEEKWNHLDFLYGLQVKELLYDEILKNIKHE